MSLRPNGVNPVCSLRKITTWLRGTNFCTSSARFALSFVRQPNGPKCIQIVQNTPKLEFRVQWGGSSAFITKNSEATSWHELLHQVGPFCTKCCNATKLAQMHPNNTKHTETWCWGPMGWIEWFVVKNYDTTSWHKLLYHFGPFCADFCKATKWYQMHPNSTKRTKTWVYVLTGSIRCVC
jgi:hypothetical protein